LGDQIQNEIGEACSIEERYIHDFGKGNLKERDHLEDLDVDGSIILKCIFKN
jgi:hypothetical protein